MEPSSPGPLTCNFEEMAQLLNVSKPTLREWLARWPDLPVLSRGSNGVAWRFDPVAVLGFIRGKREEEAAAAAARNEQLGQIALPFDGATTGAAGLDLAEMAQMFRLAKQADELGLSRGQLLRAAELRGPLTDLMTRLRAGALSLPRRWGQRHNLPGAVVAAMRHDVEDWLRGVAAGFAQQLGPEAAPANDETDAAPPGAA